MKKLIKKLIEIKKFGVTAIKQSFEDEGASFHDVLVMRKITSAAKVELNVKIGGCEAKNDIIFCRKIGVDSIVAPMVESSYAIKKFIQCFDKRNRHSLFVNLETDLALKRLSKIIKSPSFKMLKGIVIGRSDVAGSLGMTKADVNSKKIYSKVYNSFKKIKYQNKKLVFKMGGSITPSSKNFIKKLYSKKLLHRIETRNVEILLSKKSIENLKQIILKAFEFEIDWLIYKKNSNITKKNRLLFLEYTKRIKEIKERFKKFKDE